MQIPDKVKIGQYDYKVTYDEEDRLLHQDLSGEIDYQKKTIYLAKKDYSEEFIKGVFIHEVMHGIIYESGHKDICNDETLIEPTGNILYGLIINNTETFKEV